MPVSFATHFRLFKDCRSRYGRTELARSRGSHFTRSIATGFSKIHLSRPKSSKPTRTAATTTFVVLLLRFRFVTVIVSAVRGSPGLNFSDGGQVALVVTVTKWERGEFGGKYERASMEGGNVNRFIQGWIGHRVYPRLHESRLLAPSGCGGRASSHNPLAEPCMP